METDRADELQRPVEPSEPHSNAHNTQRSAWLLTAVMVLAPLLMLVTIWVLTLFRVNRP